MRSRLKLYPQYSLFLIICLIAIIFAFIVDSPVQISDGLWKIVTSRGLLITDYMAVGGVGAAMVNSAVAGICAVLMLVFSGAKPNGAIIMALWLTAGFGLFGKNIFNMIPLVAGVWLYAKIQREPFIKFSLASLLCSTLAPVVSEISFLGVFSRAGGIAMGVAMGLLCGFIFPAVSAFVVRVHDGYDLYSMGFAGGIIAMFLVSLLKSVGIEIETAQLWHAGDRLQLAALMYVICAALIAAGLILGRRGRRFADIAGGMRGMMKNSGRLVSDFYVLFGESVYINMGLLGVMGTTLILALGAELNGPTIGGVFTMIGFGAFGKHVKNVPPLLIGAVLSTLVNTWSPTEPFNILAVLFSTGLAPIAGQFGWKWGVAAGFLHVNIVIHAGYLSNGLNLYNNGFAAGFVAMLLIPIITAFKKIRGGE